METKFAFSSAAVSSNSYQMQTAPETRLLSMRNQLAGLQDQAAAHYSRLYDLASRIFGANPPTEPKSMPHPVPNGALAEIDDVLALFHATLDAQAEIIARLEQIA